MTARSVDRPVEEGKELRTHAVADARVERDLQQWPSTRDDEIVEATYGPHYASETAEQRNEKPPGPALARILSRSSAASYDPGPAPDGGLTAWIQVLCTHLTIFTTFGFFTSFGVYQTYYENTLGIAPSTISWIGSIQVFLLFFLGTFTGCATDAGLFRPVYITGACFQLVGIFTLAECKSVWQLFLSQGVCLGLANGLQFCPSMALVSTYFVKRRAFALGFTALGSCTGGVILPVIVQQCLPSLGFPWTIRIIGFIMLLLNTVTIALYRTRLPPRKAGPLVDWASFAELPYTLYCAGAFFSFWGLYFAFFYIGSYARNVLGATYQQSINLLLVQDTTPPATTALITAFPPNSYLSCNQGEANANGTGNRLFDPSTGAIFRDSASTPVTQQTCRTYCSTTAPGAPYLYFGIDYDINCRCGAAFFILRVQVDEAQCNVSAAGNSSQAGGGANRMSVWQYVA
ncbi:hypothetical protein PtrM4_063130 [Pyrenophora tritici-repentis]|nr:hypothetical protein PtrM4_063130 [Pyrenophora tritici-repentis]